MSKYLKAKYIRQRKTYWGDSGREYMVDVYFDNAWLVWEDYQGGTYHAYDGKTGGLLPREDADILYTLWRLQS